MTITRKQNTLCFNTHMMIFGAEIPQLLIIFFGYTKNKASSFLV